jgi:hypothetical protein
LSKQSNTYISNLEAAQPNKTTKKKEIVKQVLYPKIIKEKKKIMKT